ncbi:MAG: hypothetical protein Q8L21_00125 [Candidatus Komeilibacteria bacterium]|nr:hypothetical protein [Candidatus Komeilibacteria bacterium]
MIAKITPLLRLPSTADVFDYFVPPDLEAVIKPGQIVSIPWRSQEVRGVVLGLGSEGIKTFRARPVRKIINPEPILSQAQLALFKEFSKYYFCPLGSIARLVVPDEPERAHHAKIKPLIAIANLKIDKSRLPELEQAFSNIASATRYIEIKDLASFVWLVFRLLKKPMPGSVVLLFPTIHILETVAALLHVRFGDKLAIIHSELAKGAYWQEYQKILHGQAKIILSTRQGVFLPIPEKSQIILFNAGNEGFKQIDQHPRYDARVASTWLARLTDSRLFYTAPTFGLVPAKRITPLPSGSNFTTTIKLVDIKQEFALKNFSIISEQTYFEIDKALSDNKQVVIVSLRNESEDGVSRKTVLSALTKRLKNVKNIIIVPPSWLESDEARFWRGQIGCLVIASIEPLLGLPDYRANERVYYRLKEWQMWAQEFLVPIIVLQNGMALVIISLCHNINSSVIIGAIIDLISRGLKPTRILFRNHKRIMSSHCPC